MDLLARGAHRVSCSRSRVSDVAEFIQTLSGVAKGGSVVDPALVHELVEADRKVTIPLASCPIVSARSLP